MTTREPTGSEPTGRGLTGPDRLAAEYALRLLEGEELVEARGLIATDPDFADRVARWEEQLAPLQDEKPGLIPGPELWDRIERQIAHQTAQAPQAEVLTLRKRIRQWQVASMVSAAAAVALAFFTFVQPSSTQPENIANDAPLMANIPIGETQLRLAVSYIPERREMLVSASGLTADGVHDHELWLVMPEGPARSLGVVVPGEERRIALDRTLAAQISDGSQMVLTREPLGGAPEGGTAGPVVAKGEFTRS